MPPGYVYYRWRKIMKVGYAEFLKTPLDVIMQDLEFHNYEEEVKAMKYKQSEQQTGNK